MSRNFYQGTKDPISKFTGRQFAQALSRNRNSGVTIKGFHVRCDQFWSQPFPLHPFSFSVGGNCVRATDSNFDTIVRWKYPLLPGSYQANASIGPSWAGTVDIIFQIVSIDLATTITVGEFNGAFNSSFFAVNINSIPLLSRGMRFYPQFIFQTPQPTQFGGQTFTVEWFTPVSSGQPAVPQFPS